MKLPVTILGILMCLMIAPATLRGQQSKASNDKAITHLRLEITLTEYDGDKKVSSLPYTIYTAAPTQRGPASLRMGVRVPVSSGNGNSFTYMNVGTDIDCWAQPSDDGSYNLTLSVDRSSIYSAPHEGSDNQGIRALPDAPVVRNFDSRFDVSLRDGQSEEATSAADPLNGHVLKISVTLHVMK